MKKKIIAILTTIILMMMILTSCGLFVKNQERIDNQKVYTIHHKGQTEYITYQEYNRYFQQLWYRFYSSYNKDINKTVEKISEILIKRKLYIMEAKAELANGKNPSDLKVVDYLDNDEKDYTIKQMNNVFEKNFQEKVKALISTMNLDGESNSEITYSPSLEARTKISIEDKIEYTKNKNLAASDIEKTWIEKYGNDKHKSTIPSEYLNHAKIEEIKAAYEEAYDQVISEYDENGLSYNTYIVQYYENALINKYKEKIRDQISVTDQEINEKYEKLINDKKEIYSKNTQDANATEIEALLKGSSYNHIFPVLKTSENVPLQAIAVKSLLLSFNANQKKALEKMKAVFGADSDEYKANRIALATQTGLIDIDGISVEAGLKIYKSNLDYDSDKPLSSSNAPYQGELNGNTFEYNVYSYDQILAEIKADLEGVEAVVDQKYPNAVADGKRDYYINYEKQQVFVKWLNLVNDDPGMMKSDAEKYIIKVSETDFDEKYVKEFSALGNAIYKNHKGEIGVYSVSDEDGDFDFLNSKITTKNGISFVVNDFGIHIIMVVAATPNIEQESVVAYNSNYEVVDKADVEKIAYYVSGINYDLTQYGYADYNAYIKEQILNGKVNIAEQTKQNELYTINNNETGYKLNKKVLESILKPIKKEIEKLGN